MSAFASSMIGAMVLKAASAWVKQNIYLKIYLFNLKLSPAYLFPVTIHY